MVSHTSSASSPAAGAAAALRPLPPLGPLRLPLPPPSPSLPPLLLASSPSALDFFQSLSDSDPLSSPLLEEEEVGELSSSSSELELPLRSALRPPLWTALRAGRASSEDSEPEAPRLRPRPRPLPAPAPPARPAPPRAALRPCAQNRGCSQVHVVCCWGWQMCAATLWCIAWIVPTGAVCVGKRRWNRD